MAYQPQNDPTNLRGAVLTVSASGTATWGREHEITGSAAVSLALPAPTVNGSVAGVKVAAGYTGSGVTVTPPAGMTLDGAASFALTAGQENKFRYDGTTITVE